MSVILLTCALLSVPVQLPEPRLLSSSWTQLPQEPENRRELWKYVMTPVAVALGAVGQTRATLVQRLKDQTKESPYRPQKATPLRWEYLWPLDRSYVARCVIDFDKKAIVRRVTVLPAENSENRVGATQILGAGLSPCPYYLGEPRSDSSGRAEWKVDFAKAELYIDKSRVDEFWKNRDYAPVAAGTKEDANVNCFIVKRNPQTGAYLCVTSIEAIGFISRVSRTPNTATGVYDNQISYAWASAGVVKMEAGMGPYPLPLGNARVRKGMLLASQPQPPGEVPASPQATTLLEARKLVLDFSVYTETHPGLLPSPANWKDELASAGSFPLTRYSQFVYVFPGGALPDKDKRPTTVIGYVLGPGGRAVVYGDLKVRWETK